MNISSDSQNDITELKKQFEELKTFVGVFYGRYATLEQKVQEIIALKEEIKYLKEEINNLNEVCDKPPLKRKVVDLQLIKNDDSQKENVLEQPETEMKITQSSINLTVNNSLNEPIILKNKDNLSPEIKQEKNQTIEIKEDCYFIKILDTSIDGNNLYLIDSLQFDGIGIVGFKKLSQWIKRDKLYLLYDSKINGIEKDSLHKLILTKNANTNKRICLLFFTDKGFIFGVCHKRIELNITERIYLDDDQSFLFTLVNPSKVPMKVIRKYGIISKLDDNNFFYHIECGFTLKFDEESKKVTGYFSTNYSTYYKTERKILHGDDAYFFIPNPTQFKLKRIIAFEYEL
ncbi:hypothetical protein EHI8A_080890 [Entamoeba histolytica HM-1:IMSS-B]|uniref:TLDc domain-containing protein n=6 Tax=Entamoeba histolytica TaxID=5759 RepID=C4M061_ENTH1|nr:hypothetical protein EHI_021470 [Entamoeba histolytica HM-1:IMSS]EMD44827.1 Hypothetical protein EHI5A_082720 [Entamoeba histolytica KU27]EMH72203.1 hypothetical protein EHI8A_080890 [Entamoeba histolytica HM-1:IMSS-B]EMS17189.1 hypothetical protein KM1_096730 [Entamoeba histolytica HM-3:IMSS]ENY65336.1 hypothetical protein EHI7A_050890 [Entamoeba histolytica HM-1:IMSS-A]GAT94531.1 hypothetical protein CL6EHI_021470 [Entamoeba histolytica]|eukprot:XP_650748.1 hypothetical protein EHI_021470 [Entamoeba histolytica HM-1:IMSS]